MYVHIKLYLLQNYTHTYIYIYILYVRSQNTNVEVLCLQDVEITKNYYIKKSN